MIFIWGARLYGKVDEVPGMFHVATKFGHLWYIPLIPMSSHIIVEKSGSGWRGKPVGMSGKSILVAWLRGAGIFCMLGSAFGTVVALGDRSGPSAALVPVGIFAVSLFVTVFAFAYKGFRHASYERAVALGHELGLSDEGRILLELKFNKITPEDAKKALAEAARDRAEMAKLAADQTEISLAGASGPVFPSGPAVRR
jgi:hypothetical protein